MALSEQERDGLSFIFKEQLLYGAGLSTERLAQLEREYELLIIKAIRSLADKCQHNLSAMMDCITEQDLAVFSAMELDADFDIRAPIQVVAVTTCCNPSDFHIYIEKKLDAREFGTSFIISHLPALVDFIIKNGTIISDVDDLKYKPYCEVTAETKFLQIEPAKLLNFYAENKHVLVKENLLETQETLHDVCEDYLKCFAKGLQDEKCYQEFWNIRKAEYAQYKAEQAEKLLAEKSNAPKPRL